MAVDPTTPDVTSDAVLGGRLTLVQPRRGHRVGHDAMLLAAATDAQRGEHVVDLGAGVGGAGLALAARVKGISLTLIEIDPDLAKFARENVRLNETDSSLRVVNLDATASGRAFAAAGIEAGTAARVMMNPPFNNPIAQQRSPDAGRAKAHSGEPGALVAWCRTAARLLAPKGVLTLIWRADGLADVITGLAHFGEIALMPVHSRREAPAIRILVRAVKGRRSPMVLLPPFILNGQDGRPSVEAEAVLRHGAPLPLAAAKRASLERSGLTS